MEEKGKHKLCYAQTSLVKPFSQAGINVVIAIIPLGWNIEDALVFNKSSVDRGLFRSLTTNTYVHTEQKYLGDVIPEGTILRGKNLNSMKPLNMSLLVLTLHLSQRQK